MAAKPLKPLPVLAKFFAFALSIALPAIAAGPEAALSAVAAGAVGAAAKEDLRLEVARQWAEKGDYEKAVQELRLFLNEHPDAAEVYARIGTLRMRQGKLKLAADNFKVALRKDPSLQEARDGLAKVKELEAKAGSGQLQELPAAPKPGPKPGPRPVLKPLPPDAGYSPALDSGDEAGAQGIYAMKEFQEALRLYREKKPDPSAAMLKRVLAKSPGHPGAYYLGGVIRYEKGELDKAEYNFKRSYDYPHRGFNAHFYMGRIQHRLGHGPLAISHYEKYMKLTKSEPGRKQAQAYIDQLRGKPLDAHAKDTAHVDTGRGAHAKAADTHGKDAHAHGHGDHGHGHGHGDQGAKPAAPAEELPPAPVVLSKDGYLPFVVADNAGASGRKLLDAYEAFKREKYEKSADLLKEVIKQFGGSPNAEAAELDLAAVYVRLGLWENAKDRIVDYLAKAQQPQRYRDLAFYLEALMHLGKKDGEKAERALLKVKAGGFGGPGQEEIDFRLAQAGGLMKDVKKQGTYLEKALASASTPLRKATLQQQLGQLHAKHGRPERAVEHYRKSMEACAKSIGDGGEGFADLCPESRLRVADLEFRRKRWPEALSEYRKFTADYPDHGESAWVHYQIANIYQATRNLESALNEYKKVIDNYPDSYWASQAQWKREDAIWRKEYEEVLD